MQTVQIVSCRNIFFPSYREQRVLCINIWFVRVTPLHTCMCNIMSYLFISFRIFWNDSSIDRQHRHIWSWIFICKSYVFLFIWSTYDCSYDLPYVILICFDVHMLHIWFSFEMQCSRSNLFCTYDCTFPFNLLYSSYYNYIIITLMFPPIKFIWVICTQYTTIWY